MKSTNISKHYRVKGEPAKELDIDADNAKMPIEAKAAGEIKRRVDLIPEGRALGEELGEIWGELDDE